MRHRLPTIIVLLLLLAVCGVSTYIFSNRVEVIAKQLADIFGQPFWLPSYRSWEAEGIEWYQDIEGKVNVAILSQGSELDFRYTVNEADYLFRQAQQSQYSLAINGGYYLGSYVEARPAGLLQVRGSRHTDYISSIQLTHFAIYNHASHELIFTRAATSDLTVFTDLDYSIVQSGPILIDQGVVQTEFIEGALNSDQSSLRTVIGKLDDGRIFMAVTRVGFSLPQLVEFLQEFQPLAGQNISALNLDGGSSTAMYAEDLDQFDFRDEIRLPMVIGVKPPTD